MMKMNLTNDQAALEYALYMIVGSCFKKTICERSKFQERKLFLHYQEQKREIQYVLEDQCIRYTEEVLMPMLPESVGEMEAEVHFRKMKDGRTCICFRNSALVIAVTAEYRGRKKPAFASCLKMTAGRAGAQITGQKLI